MSPEHQSSRSSGNSDSEDMSTSQNTRDEKVFCVDRQMRKTKLCTFHLRNLCRYGNKCFFAHDGAELQTVPDLSRTRLCNAFMTVGSCSDPNCRFAHGQDELRGTPTFYKTALCLWHKHGKCMNGAKCRFAHGRHELRTEPKKAGNWNASTDDDRQYQHDFEKPRPAGWVETSAKGDSLTMDSLQGHYPQENARQRPPVRPSGRWNAFEPGRDSGEELADLCPMKVPLPGSLARSEWDPDFSMPGFAAPQLLQQPPDIAAGPSVSMTQSPPAMVPPGCLDRLASGPPTDLDYLPMTQRQLPVSGICLNGPTTSQPARLDGLGMRRAPMQEPSNPVGGRSPAYAHNLNSKGQLRVESELLLQMLSTLTKSSEIIVRSVPAETEAPAPQVMEQLQILTTHLQHCQGSVLALLENGMLGR